MRGGTAYNGPSASGSSTNSGAGPIDPLIDGSKLSPVHWWLLG